MSITLTKTAPRKRLLSAFILLFFIVPGQAAEGDPALVTLFGDSITFGFIAPGVGNGALNVGNPDIILSQLLNDSGRPSLVANHGWGGTPSGPAGTPGLVAIGNGLQRVASNLNSVKLAYPNHSRRFVMILYGINDQGWGIPTSTTGFNVGQIGIQANFQGFSAVVGTITPCICGVSSLLSRNESIRANVAALQAQGRDIQLVDQYQLLINSYPQFLFSDGIHPMEEGQRQIATNWFNQSLAGRIPEIPQSVVIAPILGLLLDD